MGKSETVDALLNIGSIIAIILGIIGAIGGSRWWGWGGGVVWDIIWGIVAILLGLGMLGTTGLLKDWKFLKFPKEFVPMLIIGLIILVPTSNWGGLLIVIAALIHQYGT
nr:hypothetical protein [Candidatus Sigynarchaeota archaeon]